MVALERRRQEVALRAAPVTTTPTDTEVKIQVTSPSPIPSTNSNNDIQLETPLEYNQNNIETIDNDILNAESLSDNSKLLSDNQTIEKSTISNIKNTLSNDQNSSADIAALENISLDTLTSKTLYDDQSPNTVVSQLHNDSIMITDHTPKSDSLITRESLFDKSDCEIISDHKSSIDNNVVSTSDDILKMNENKSINDTVTQESLVGYSNIISPNKSFTVDESIKNSTLNENVFIDNCDLDSISSELKSNTADKSMMSLDLPTHRLSAISLDSVESEFSKLLNATSPSMEAALNEFNTIIQDSDDHLSNEILIEDTDKIKNIGNEATTSKNRDETLSNIPTLSKIPSGNNKYPEINEEIKIPQKPVRKFVPAKPNKIINVKNMITPEEFFDAIEPNINSSDSENENSEKYFDVDTWEKYYNKLFYNNTKTSIEQQITAPKVTAKDSSEVKNLMKYFPTSRQTLQNKLPDVNKTALKKSSPLEKQASVEKYFYGSNSKTDVKPSAQSNIILKPQPSVKKTNIVNINKNSQSSSHQEVHVDDIKLFPESHNLEINELYEKPNVYQSALGSTIGMSSVISRTSLPDKYFSEKPKKITSTKLMKQAEKTNKHESIFKKYFPEEPPLDLTADKKSYENENFKISDYMKDTPVLEVVRCVENKPVKPTRAKKIVKELNSDIKENEVVKPSRQKKSHDSEKESVMQNSEEKLLAIVKSDGTKKEKTKNDCIIS